MGVLAANNDYLSSFLNAGKWAYVCINDQVVRIPIMIISFRGKESVCPMFLLAFLFLPAVFLSDSCQKIAPFSAFSSLLL